MRTSPLGAILSVPGKAELLRPLTPQTLRVVLADDSGLVRETIAYLLASIPHVELVAACGDADSLTATVAAEQPDLVVLGVGLSGADGVDGIRIADRLRDAADGIGVLEIGHLADLRVPRDGDRQAYLRKIQLLDRDQLAAALDEVGRAGS
jgi:CheY-like chemotaxis protein